MKFKLETSGYFYPQLNDRKRLEKIGFTFRKSSSCFIIDNSPEIEINSLDELIEFINKFGKIIIHTDTIEIYDNYRE